MQLQITNICSVHVRTSTLISETTLQNKYDYKLYDDTK